MQADYVFTTDSDEHEEVENKLNKIKNKYPFLEPEIILLHHHEN